MNYKKTITKNGESYYNIYLDKFRDGKGLFKKLLKKHNIDKKYYYQGKIFLSDIDKPLIEIRKELAERWERDSVPMAYKKSEADYQAEIYCELKKLGYLVRLEVKSVAGRHDIVIFSGKPLRAILIIELKRNLKALSKSAKQIGKYKGLPMPVLFAIVNKKNEIIEYVKAGKYRNFKVIK